jgi:thiol-disulfide isomerase/thioredoxin
MKRFICVCLTFVVWNVSMAFAQATPVRYPANGLDLLRRVSSHYANAKSYYLESTEEYTRTSEYEQETRKTLMVAAEASDHRYYFEGRSAEGGSMEIADGKQIWDYRVDEHRYTVKTEPDDANPRQAEGNSSLDGARTQAVILKRSLADYAVHLNSAEQLPDQIIQINGQDFSCFVVRIKSADEKRPQADYIFERTIWIDRKNETFVRAFEHAHGDQIVGSAHVPYEIDLKDEYFSTQLGPAARKDIFSFTPPADAQLVATLSPAQSKGANFSGGQVPSLNLKSADGGVTSVASFRGKPVLIDFWATWCGACVASLPDLAQLYSQASQTSLVIITVDNDEEAVTADTFLKRNGYPWRNFHDGDGTIEKLMGNSPIPRTVLVDAQGQVVYDGTGTDENQLRAAIASLGPEYLSLLRKPDSPPCIASK